MRPLRPLLLSLLALGAVLVLPAAAQAKRTVPYGWFGSVVTDPALLYFDSVLRPESAVMRASGVESVRAPVYWSQMQRYRRWEDIPAAQRDQYVMSRGVPTSFASLDQLVANTLRRNIRFLPTVLDAPKWGDIPNHGRIGAPKRVSDYTRFLLTLVDRYGEDGTFWDTHPDVPYRPVRHWQIWNEPDHPNFWRRPWIKGYVKLVKASRKALKRADRRNVVVLGSLTGVSWYNLRRLYKAGLKGSFDVVAIHPYTKSPKHVITTIERVRAVMRAYRNIKPVEVAELSWPASRGKIPRSREVSFSTTTAEQTRRLSACLKLLVKHRKRLRISGVYWFTWLSRYSGDSPWEYTGLRKFNARGEPVSLPPLAAFKRIALSREGRR